MNTSDLELIPLLASAYENAPLVVAYFVNQYPKVSHSFIRREILALERQGVDVSRIALRGWNEAVIDEDDIAEKDKTRYVLKGGLPALAAGTLKRLVRSPVRFAAAARMALSMSARSDRPLLYHLVSLGEACCVFDLLKQSGATHVHAHFGTNSAEVVMLVKALGGPGYSFTVHGPEEFDKVEALHLKEKIERARFVVAISSYGRSQLYRSVEREQWEKIKVVHCGLEQAFHAVDAVSVHDSQRLVCVGRLCEQKGQLLLIEAARRLAEQGIAFELVLAGDGEMRNEIEALVARYGLADRVHITGWISSDQVREILLSARALVLPSFAEGLPVVIMEAMALRRPVLTTYVAGIPELVVDGKTGWLIPAGSIDALTAAMKRCLLSPAAVLQAMGDAGYQRVLEQHDVDHEAAKLAHYFSGNGL